MKNSIQQSIRTILNHPINYLLISMAFFSIILLIGNLISSSLFSIIMKSRGYTLLSIETLIQLLKDPITLILLILVLLVVVYTALVSYVFCYLLWLKPNQLLGNGILAMIHFIIKSLHAMIKKSPLMVLIMGLLVIPFDMATQIPTAFQSIVVPSFLVKTVLSNVNGTVIFIAFILTLYCLNVLFAFAWCVMLSEEHVNAIKRSINLSKKHFLKLMLGFIIIELALGGITLLFYLGLNFLLDVCNYWLHAHSNVLTLAISLITVLRYLLFSVVATFLSLSISGFVSHFYAHVTNTTSPAIKEREATKRTIHVFWIGIILVSSLINFFSFRSLIHNQWFNTDNEIMVIAHRGSSYHAPENTLPAFEKAIEENADMIELDVHLTREGELVVFHDDQLKRLFQIDKNTIDLTEADLKTLVLTHNGIDAQIPKLEQVFKQLGNKVKLLVELKTSDHTPGLEKAVVDLIVSYNLEEHVLIQSMDMNALLNVHALNPAIKIGYIMSYAISSYQQEFDVLDFFSIEQSSLDLKLTTELKRKGKAIYIWTVDDQEEVELLVHRGISGIITNNPSVMRGYLNYYQTQPRINFIKDYFNAK